MNIYVGNLSYRVRENDLQGVMAEYGQVQSCKIVKDRETNKSKGFAFVEMDDAGAEKIRFYRGKIPEADDRCYNFFWSKCYFLSKRDR